MSSTVVTPCSLSSREPIKATVKFPGLFSLPLLSSTLILISSSEKNPVLFTVALNQSVEGEEQHPATTSSASKVLDR